MEALSLCQEHGGPLQTLTGSPDCLQLRKEDLKSVVANLRREFDLDFVYCWHALHAYWCGVSPDAPGTQAYASKLVYPKPTPGESQQLQPTLGCRHAIACLGRMLPGCSTATTLPSGGVHAYNP